MDQNQENELAASIEIEVQKLIFLITNSNMPDEIKEALMQTLPSFSLEELDRLSKILEAKFLDEKTRDIDDEYKTKLEDLVVEYKNKENKLNQEVENEVQKLKNLYEGK